MLEGAVLFFVGGEVVLAEAGDVVVAPAGAPRTFRVESQRARWLIRTRVASMQRFEEFGWAVAPAAGGGWTSLEEASTIAAIGAPNGIELLGPPGLLRASASLLTSAFFAWRERAVRPVRSCLEVVSVW